MSTDLTSAAYDRAAMAMSSNQIQSPEQTANYQRAEAVAKEYEGVFISQMLSQMFKGIETDKMFGGGAGENMFRSLMIDQYGKKIASDGGIGLAKPILNQLISVQEQASQKSGPQKHAPQHVPEEQAS